MSASVKTSFPPQVIENQSVPPASGGPVAVKICAPSSDFKARAREREDAAAVVAEQAAPAIQTFQRRLSAAYRRHSPSTLETRRRAARPVTRLKRAATRWFDFATGELPAPPNVHATVAKRYARRLKEWMQSVSQPFRRPSESD
jgi:hypothetical protein